MTAFRVVALSAFAAFVIAVATAPAGSAVTSVCDSAIAHIKDPGLRASFEKLETTRSATARRICAGF